MLGGPGAAGRESLSWLFGLSPFDPQTTFRQTGEPELAGCLQPGELSESRSFASHSHEWFALFDYQTMIN
jgi:hypothetical protein